MRIDKHLSDTLSQALLGTPYDYNSNQPERFLIDHLVEVFEDYAMSAEYSRDEVRAEFRKHQIPNFDVDQYIGQLVEMGVLVDHDETD